MTVKAAAPSFGGREEIRVGRTRFGIPRGSKFVHVNRNGAALAYVLDLDGSTVRCLVAQGEIPLPTHLQRILLNKIFGITLAEQFDGERNRQIKTDRLAARAARST